jgi:hypothetical protein
LGSQIAEKEYKDLWVGKTLKTSFKKGIDSPTGATYTFLNFFKTVKDVLEIYNEKILRTPVLKSENNDKIINVKNVTKAINIVSTEGALKLEESESEEKTEKQEA